MNRHTVLYSSVTEHLVDLRLLPSKLIQLGSVAATNSPRAGRTFQQNLGPRGGRSPCRERLTALKARNGAFFTAAPARAVKKEWRLRRRRRQQESSNCRISLPPPTLAHVVFDLLKLVWATHVLSKSDQMETNKFR